MNKFCECNNKESFNYDLLILDIELYAASHNGADLYKFAGCSQNSLNYWAEIHDDISHYLVSLEESEYNAFKQKSINNPPHYQKTIIDFLEKKEEIIKISSEKEQSVRQGNSCWLSGPPW